MLKPSVLLGLICFLWRTLPAQPISSIDTVTLYSDHLRLKALLFKPKGPGPFPAVLFSHGSHSFRDSLQDVPKEMAELGAVFTKRKWIFLGVCRRGVGLSKGQGVSGGDLMIQSFNEKGQEGRNKTQMEIMEGGEYDDLISGLNFLLNAKDVDKQRIALVGHSFGASLGLILASKNKNLKATVLFSPGGYTWDLSDLLRNRLIRAAREISIPFMVIHAENDYSTHPGIALDSLTFALHKTHLLKIYPPFGHSASDGHALICKGVDIWENDTFDFLDKYVLR